MLNLGLLNLFSCMHHNHKPLVFEYWVLYLSNKSNKYKKYRFMRYSVEFQSPPGCLLLIFPTYKLTSSWKCTIVLYSIEMEALSLNLPVCPVHNFFSARHWICLALYSHAAESFSCGRQFPFWGTSFLRFLFHQLFSFVLFPLRGKPMFSSHQKTSWKCFFAAFVMIAYYCK